MGGGSDLIRQPVEGCLELGYLSCGFCPVALLDRFADTGQCLDTIARVQTGSVDQMAEPGAAGEPAF